MFYFVQRIKMLYQSNYNPSKKFYHSSTIMRWSKLVTNTEDCLNGYIKLGVDSIKTNWIRLVQVQFKFKKFNLSDFKLIIRTFERIIKKCQIRKKIVENEEKEEMLMK